MKKKKKRKSALENKDKINIKKKKAKKKKRKSALENKDKINIKKKKKKKRKSALENKDKINIKKKVKKKRKSALENKDKINIKKKKVKKKKKLNVPSVHTDVSFTASSFVQVNRTHGCLRKLPGFVCGTRVSSRLLPCLGNWSSRTKTCSSLCRG